ncbi:hypothetical protein WJX84_007181 [Apatococcus fuscideae]|uniref:Patatin n=1 Tax=Apatococcus fuscideae TaxID=2026836 RepID=A0AAW1T1B8_9CHLO
MNSSSSESLARSAALRALTACQHHKRAAALAVALGILAASEVCNRGVSRTLTSIRRGIAAAVATWVEEAGGLPLYTTEGNEPEDTAMSWKLPGLRGRRGSETSETSSQQQPGEALPAVPLDDSCLGRQSLGSDASSSTAEAPNFFASTKFFSCLDWKASQQLHEASQTIRLGPQDLLFEAGDDSSSGIYIVLEGQLGSYLHIGEQLLHTNTLCQGESVGDLDVLDGNPRSVTCVALEQGAVLVQISRELFLEFVADRPRTLLMYLQTAIARLWRVAFFVLRSFLELPVDSMAQPTGIANALSMAPTLAAAATLTTELGLPPALSSHASSHIPSRLGRQQSSYRHALLQGGGRDAPDLFRPGLSAVKEGSEEAGQESGSPPASQAPSMVSPFSAFSQLEPFKRARSLSDEGQQAVDGVAAAPRAPSTRASSMMPHLAHRASLKDGWDVVSRSEGGLGADFFGALKDVPDRGLMTRLTLQLARGDILLQREQLARRFFLLLKGRLLAQRVGKEGQPESALIQPGSLISCAAHLSNSRSLEGLQAAEDCRLLAFSPAELSQLLEVSSELYMQLLLAASHAFGALIRQFISLGFNRVWLHAGETAYQQGEAAHCLYLVISGRLRLLREDAAARPPVRVEEEVGRGEAVGAVWALTAGMHDTTAHCIRDSELVRLTKGSFELIAMQHPQATQAMLENMARRIAAATASRCNPNPYDSVGSTAMSAGNSGARPTAKLGLLNTPSAASRGEIVTIALVPSGAPNSRASSSHTPASMPARKLGVALKATFEQSCGRTLHVTSRMMEMSFPTAFSRLRAPFYRTKITTWMASQEEEFRFILLEADADATEWSKLCLAQADCILLVAAGRSRPEVTGVEEDLIQAVMGPSEDGSADDGTPINTTPRYSNSHGLPMDLLSGVGPSMRDRAMSDAKGRAARFRRIELVLLHEPDAEPQGTAEWLKRRSYVCRHHHIRLSYMKDMERLSRWMDGKAVGLVLSGGGSRGLAHLGVLRALDDAGISVDVVGGTSQGAFMAGLFAQGLSWEAMQLVTQSYARQMSSVRHLLWDITIPILSVFTGRAFDRVVKESFQYGASHIEDLWLRYFCMSTNLSKGKPNVHTIGLLWRLIRASMTIVGMVPPVYEDGDLLVDGGYLNNLPVDVIRSMGVEMVIVVDVEDRDASTWHEITPYDGGISGWQLLWDRWCPIPSLRFFNKLPRIDPYAVSKAAT